jgi:hypothetical protein
MQAPIETIAIESTPDQEQRPETAPSWKPTRIEMALIAGCCPRTDRSRWLLLDRNGEPTRSLFHVKYFAFSMSGYRAARKASRIFRETHAPDAINFTARVVVYGDWAAPQDVVEAWRLEGTEPRDIGRYPFE